MTADPTAAPDRSPSVTLDPSARPPVILLDHHASWGEIREDAATALQGVAATWAGAEAHLDLGLREPDLFDLRRLVHLLDDDFDVKIVGLRCLDDALRRFAERELKVRIHLQRPEPAPQADESGQDDAQDTDTTSAAPPEPSEEAPRTAETEPAPSSSAPVLGAGGYPVRIVQRTLRGGTVLRHSGELVLYGDVKPGAEIIAGGSITVLGTMMGMAHAGTRSGDRAWIVAHDLRPTQLRIGTRITISEPAGAGSRSTGPEIAFVRDGSIVIESYRGRLPRNASRRSDA
jgi:septum site-determining protein MinC